MLHVSSEEALRVAVSSKKYQQSTLKSFIEHAIDWLLA